MLSATSKGTPWDVVHLVKSLRGKPYHLTKFLPQPLTTPSLSQTHTHTDKRNVLTYAFLWPHMRSHTGIQHSLMLNRGPKGESPGKKTNKKTQTESRLGTSQSLHFWGQPFNQMAARTTWWNTICVHDHVLARSRDFLSLLVEHFFANGAFTWCV